ncbi:molybdopterin molybdotransferase MoeA [Spiribacter onubensis]|uniref:Molybdopterin molybdenumtransferase n=1 Tax=Spiribacter onubensis TaxID=3122420 RepID=A0ABV3SDI5_9GAMM
MTDPCETTSLTVADALDHLRRTLTPVVGHRRVAIREALGHVLARDIVADQPVPAHDNSAMDGYAVRGDDAGADSLRCVGKAFAGQPFTGEVAAGECVRIMTGGVIPAGATAVVMQEQTDADGDTVMLRRWPGEGENIRRAGDDLQAGDTILPAGRRITPADLGVMASLGRAEVDVFRPLRVAFFSTGDELRGVGEALGAGDIYDSNRYSLYGMLTRLQVERLDLGVVPDNRAAVREALASAAAEADVVVTSGGVSVGEADYVGQVLQERGEAHFWSLAMKPGRPLTFGRYADAWFFGLPGNPVSVMATFTQVVTPALRQLAGETSRPRARFRLPCRSDLGKKPGRQDFQRGRIVVGEDGVLAVESVGRQGSGMLRSMSAADCFIVLPADSGDVTAGEWVTVEPFAGPLI